MAPIDRTWSFMRDPYRFLSRSLTEPDSSEVETRIQGKATLCIRGADAAEQFYDSRRFHRAAAIPRQVRRIPCGEGSVHGLDGDAHRHRKAMFMSMMTSARIDRLCEFTIDEWSRRASEWPSMGYVDLYTEASEMFTRAACAWAGVPLPDRHGPMRAHELRALFEGAGAIGPRHWWARIARRRCHRWMTQVIEDIRHRQLQSPSAQAASIIAHHRDLDGRLLPADVAAVELLNVVRPIVVVSVYVVFIAHALHLHPAWRSRVRRSSRDLVNFVAEVRRHYPSSAVVSARVGHGFRWHGFHRTFGTRVILDIFGTNHDSTRWANPDQFDPDRFDGHDVGAHDLIPQGAGEHRTEHRCAGEWVTIALMRQAARFLSQCIRYQVVDSDLAFDIARSPALPRSSLRLSRVRPRIPTVDDQFGIELRPGDAMFPKLLE